MHVGRSVGGPGGLFVHLIGNFVKRNGAQPLAAPRFFCQRRSSGWTLIELVIVLAVLAIITYFVVRAFQPKDALALQQAERLRNDLRQMQMLAITWGQALRLNAAATNYSVSCVTASASPPCNAAPVINPANGRPFLVALEPGLDLAGPGFALDLDALGRPKNGAAFIPANATFTITGAAAPRTVVVTPLTGFVTAQ
jgi:prepilin-type N-terminal cleavage/methylation domain-containing protein